MWKWIKSFFVTPAPVDVVVRTENAEGKKIIHVKPAKRSYCPNGNR